ncbi:MAG: ferredoxin family protein [Collinsella sp.]
MAHPVIDADECIACGVCVDSCPAGVLELQDVATVADEDSCVACGACQTLARWRDHRDRRGVTTPTCTLKSTPCTKGGLRIAAEASFHMAVA